MRDVNQVLSREAFGESTSAETPGTGRAWIVAATVIGTTIAWYDFFIYGTAAALVFNKVFFPSFDAAAGTIAAFATFAIGLLARPFGGIVFGHFGDRFGRKSTLMVSLLLMGIPTMLIGLVPAYKSIGLWAAAILVTLRLLQGFALGGEWGGAVLMAVEHAPKARRVLFSALPQAGAPAGLVLASLTFALVSHMHEASLLAWGWRLPFLLSILLASLKLPLCVQRRLARSGGGASCSSSPFMRRQLPRHAYRSVRITGANAAVNQNPGARPGPCVRIGPVAQTAFRLRPNKPNDPSPLNSSQPAAGSGTGDV